jgi:hypothetical protein
LRGRVPTNAEHCSSLAEKRGSFAAAEMQLKCAVESMHFNTQTSSVRDYSVRFRDAPEKNANRCNFQIDGTHLANWLDDRNGNVNDQPLPA